MCHHMWIAAVLLAVFVAVSTDTESLEDIPPPYTYSFSNPSALNFRDIYANMVTSAEEKQTEMDEDILLSTTEEIYLLPKAKGQFVEFRPEFTTVGATAPPPKYLLNYTYIENQLYKSRRKVTTEDPAEEEVIKLVPKDMQRGVLDLLFPESRVKSFRDIFNTIKRMLSHTFRR